MNGVALKARTDEDIIELSEVDFKIEAAIHCAPTPSNGANNDNF